MLEMITLKLPICAHILKGAWINYFTDMHRFMQVPDYNLVKPHSELNWNVLNQMFFTSTTMFLLTA